MSRRVVRFRFTLKSLFAAVTVGAVLLGWQVRVVRERGRYRSDMLRRGAIIQLWETPDWQLPLASHPVFLDKRSRFPEYQRYFGDEPLYYINVRRCGMTWDERQYIAQLFPEAFVVPEHPEHIKKQGLAGATVH